jgi:phosphatidyl-myo-inositol dimannoside synthase
MRQREFLVLVADVEGVRGIERVTRTFVAALSQQYGAAHVHVLSLPSDQLASLLASVRRARLLRDSQLVIIACQVQLALTAWAAARASGAPYAIWCRGIEAGRALTPWHRFGLRRASITFAPSHSLARAIERTAGLPEGATRVVPPGLSPEVVIRREESRRPTVCAVSRLMPADAHTGIDVLIRAWPLVLAVVPDASLQVVGDGADRARLGALADALDVTHRIHFTGTVSEGELADLYGRAHAFALPSRTPLGPIQEGEGLDLTFLEASAAGLPLLAGRGTAAEEIVVDGVSGLLVDARDVRLVADALVRLLMDPGLARQFGAAGRARAAQLFSPVAFRQAVACLLDGAVEAPLEPLCAESSAR